MEGKSKLTDNSAPLVFLFAPDLLMKTAVASLRLLALGLVAQRVEMIACRWDLEA